MSSCDHGRSKPRRAAGWVALFALAASAMVSSCTVQPLYGMAAGGGKVSATLAKIAIDPVDDRVAQQVRNNLIFGLAGGKEVSDPAYKMKLTVSSHQSELGLTHIEAAPTYTVTVTATYEITKTGSTAVIATGTARGSASYDRMNQVFANVRARVDAENRAAVAAADNIRLRVAAAVARGV
jgi:LPS-assembly lipoprotein